MELIVTHDDTGSQSVYSTNRRRSWSDLTRLRRALVRQGPMIKKSAIELCSLYPRFGLNHVEVRKNFETNRVSVSGVHRCANGWLCPICAPDVLRARAEEITNALSELCPGVVYDVPSRGNLRHVTYQRLYFMTYTARHRKSDNPSVFVERMSEARRIFARSKYVTSLRRRAVGYISASEAIWGDNGLHYHKHELWALQGSVDPSLLLDIWRRACVKVGLRAGKHSFHVKPWDAVEIASAARYLTKWTPTSELTSGVKSDPLWRAPSSQLPGIFDALKGRSRIRWSVGFRAALSLPDSLDDAALLEEDEIFGNQHSMVIFLIQDSIWQKIAITPGAIPKILETCETKGAEAGLAVAMSFA